MIMETSEIIKKVRKIEIKTRGLSSNIFAGHTVTADGYDKDFRFSFSHDRIPLTSLPFAAVDHGADDVPEDHHIAHAVFQRLLQ